MATATRKTTAKSAAKTTTAKTKINNVQTTTVDENKENTDVKNNNTVNKNDDVKVNDNILEVKEKKAFTDSDYILCRSVWSGGLNIVSQSGNLYEFNDYGAECEINYRDLVTMIRRGSDHIFTPRFVILDDDFLEDFPTVRKLYGEMYTMSDLEDILALPNAQMEREINKLPEATKESMRNLIATQIANGKLDSISKVRTLTEIFNSDFNLLSDLFVK